MDDLNSRGIKVDQLVMILLGLLMQGWLWQASDIDSV